jgi:hypothetical protein
MSLRLAKGNEGEVRTSKSSNSLQVLRGHDLRMFDARSPISCVTVLSVRKDIFKYVEHDVVGKVANTVNILHQWFNAIRKVTSQGKW